jgi:hypothetical protein
MAVSGSPAATINVRRFYVADPWGNRLELVGV